MLLFHVFVVECNLPITLKNTHFWNRVYMKFVLCLDVKI